MGSALDISVGIVGYFALFVGVGLVFVFVNLLIGRFVRPANPHEEKLEIYECGEPSIGSSFVQFDLRFYVVALVFIIFDVEVAFLFPWATVFGKVTNLRNEMSSAAVVAAGEAGSQVSPDVAGVYLELGDPSFVSGAAGVTSAADLLDGWVVGAETGQAEVAYLGLNQIAAFATIAVAVFFVVLLVGFAYEWRTGALDWVRAVSQPGRSPVQRTIIPSGRGQGSVLSS